MTHAATSASCAGRESSAVSSGERPFEMRVKSVSLRTPPSNSPVRVKDKFKSLDIDIVGRGSESNCEERRIRTKCAAVVESTNKKTHRRDTRSWVVGATRRERRWQRRRRRRSRSSPLLLRGGGSTTAVGARSPTSERGSVATGRGTARTAPRTPVPAPRAKNGRAGGKEGRGGGRWGAGESVSE